VSVGFIKAGSGPQFTATSHNVLVLPFPYRHNIHSDVQLEFLCLCRLQQLDMSSRLTVVLVSLLLATPAVMFWLWLVIQPIKVLCPEECRCNANGYYVNCLSSGLNSIPLILPTHVRILVLFDNNITFLEKDSFVSRGLTEMEILMAIFCQIGTIDLGAFNGLTMLKNLSLFNNEITEIIPGTFERMNNLQHLDLQHNKIEHLEVKVFSGLINLQIVYLAVNKLHYLHPDTFLGLPKLQSLYLSDNPGLQTLTDRHFINSHSLKQLDISSCNVSSMSAETFANVSALETIDLSYNNLRNVDINILKALPQLTALYLQGNPLQCDCQLQGVWQWCKDHNIQTAYKEKAPECDTPSEVEGISWEVLEKRQCLEDNIQYYEDYINTSYNYTMSEETETDTGTDTDTDTGIDKDKDTGMGTDTVTDTDTHTESEQNGYMTSFLNHYEVPVYAVFFIFGTTGNIILIIIIICNKDMRTIPNMYVLNVAISDMICLTVLFFETCTSTISYTWLHDGFMCSFIPFLRRLSVGLTTYSVTLLSIQRYRVTVNPFHVRVSSQPTWRATVATICVVWILAALFAIPSGRLKYLCSEPRTLPNIPYFQRVVIFELLVSCLLPLCLIVFSNTMTAFHLVKNSDPISEGTQNPQLNTRKNSAKVVLGLTVVFLISYLPNHAFKAYTIYTVGTNLSAVNLDEFVSHILFKLQYTLAVTKCLLLINSCLNPVALFCSSLAFRRQFKRYLTCCCKAKPPPNGFELTRRN
jgi:Leucine-rich repeat (LRR) protein